MLLGLSDARPIELPDLQRRTRTLQLPGEDILHVVASGSLWKQCDADIYGFRFGTDEGDQLTGCVR